MSLIVDRCLVKDYNNKALILIVCAHERHYQLNAHIPILNTLSKTNMFKFYFNRIDEDTVSLMKIEEINSDSDIPESDDILEPDDIPEPDVSDTFEIKMDMIKRVDSLINEYDTKLCKLISIKKDLTSKTNSSVQPIQELYNKLNDCI